MSTKGQTSGVIFSALSQGRHFINCFHAILKHSLFQDKVFWLISFGEPDSLMTFSWYSLETLFEREKYACGDITDLLIGQSFPDHGGMPLFPHCAITFGLKVGGSGVTFHMYSAAFIYHPRIELKLDQQLAEATCPQDT